MFGPAEEASSGDGEGLNNTNFSSKYPQSELNMYITFFRWQNSIETYTILLYLGVVSASAFKTRARIPSSKSTPLNIEILVLYYVYMSPFCACALHFTTEHVQNMYCRLASYVAGT